ncbi:hypothetical protein P3393_22175 [Vibrio parahaemolyticus]|nr:hypothetical protein [Vibrio parahaemolyticus]
MSAQLEEYVYNPRILKDVSDTLLGIDLNKNNIRDDVDKVVNHLEVTEADKEFMLRYIQYATSILSSEESPNDFDKNHQVKVDAHLVV